MRRSNVHIPPQLVFPGSTLGVSEVKNWISGDGAVVEKS
jgi:hypothetical protein